MKIQIQKKLRVTSKASADMWKERKKKILSDSGNWIKKKENQLFSLLLSEQRRILVHTQQYQWIYSELCSVCQGELCQDMFISPESDAWATCAPCELYVSTVCSQQPRLNGQALFTAHYAFIHIAVAHGLLGSVVRATAWLLMFPRWWVLQWFPVWEVGTRGRWRAAVSSQLQTPCSPAA